MPDKFFGVWIPSTGWLRFNRPLPTGGYEQVAWATLERPLAAYYAREFNGYPRRIDEALGSVDGQMVLLKAEQERAARVSWWRKLLKR